MKVELNEAQLKLLQSCLKECVTFWRRRRKSKKLSERGREYVDSHILEIKKLLFNLPEPE